MKNYIRPLRLAVLAILLTAVLGLYAVTLYDIQILNANASAAASDIIKRTYPVTATRGDILDRNGTVLISSVGCYNIKLDYFILRSSGSMCQSVLSLINLAEDNGITYVDTLPITKNATFAYTGMTTSQKTRIDAFKSYYKMKDDISASDLIVWLKSHYGIDYTTSLSDARKIIGVLYELEVRNIVNTADYAFASDVGVNFASLVMERGLLGVTVETKTKRECHTDYAAHLLGRVGLMTSEEYKTYKELDYAMDAYVGKDGVELAFENYLHGTDGAETVIYDKTTGAVIQSDITKQAENGGNVVLTIDIGLQAAAENALAATIDEINDTRGPEDEKATGGAIVVLDVKTSGALAIASNPTFDIETASDNYAQLSADPASPLFNRATQGIYNPGSTFKMVTSYAGLTVGKIDLGTYVYDQSRYTAYKGYQPRCWIYPQSHGSLNVIGALANSCNYFYYWLGDNIGIDAISTAARQFGFGEKTGIEITESAGVVATPEYKKELIDEPWYAADNLITAIGQGYNNFTPLQIANYIACIANGGELNKVTLLNSVLSSDYLSVQLENETEILNNVDNSKGFVDILQNGMKAVVAEGTAKSYFVNYPIEIAAKTGTVQSDGTTFNNAVFVCYAPADDPEIAVAIVIEKGGSGSSIIPTAKKVLNYYFADYFATSETTENILLK